MGVVALAGIHAKLARAARHTEELGELLDPASDQQPFEIVEELDVNAGEYRLRRRLVNEQFEPATLGAIVGDIAFNLRSLLDHLVWGLIKEQGQEPRPMVQFPVCSAPEDFVKQLKDKRSSIDQLSSEVVAKIEFLQPYHRDEDEALAGHWGPHPIELIHQLNRLDKHRAITPTIAAYFAGPVIQRLGPFFLSSG